MTAPGRLRRLAVLLLLLCLAAPAGAALAPGTSYLPGWCTTTYDADGWASMSCTPGSISVAYTAVGTIGLGHPVRIFVAVTLALLALGGRQRSRRLLQAAVAAGALGFFFGGVGGISRLLVAAAVTCLALAVRAEPDGADDPSSTALRRPLVAPGGQATT